MFTPVKAVTLDVDVDVEVSSKPHLFKACRKQSIINKLTKEHLSWQSANKDLLNGLTAPKVLVSFHKKAEKMYFVHFQAIVGDGYKTLNENDKVEFSVTQGPKGLQAAEVKKIS